MTLETWLEKENSHRKNYEWMLSIEEKGTRLDCCLLFHQPKENNWSIIIDYATMQMVSKVIRPKRLRNNTPFNESCTKLFFMFSRRRQKTFYHFEWNLLHWFLRRGSNGISIVAEWLVSNEGKFSLRWVHFF